MRTLVVMAAAAVLAGCSAGQGSDTRSRRPPDAGAVESGVDASPDGSVDPATWAARDLIAARLSRFLWNQATPDAAIVSAVGAAVSARDVGEVARRMLADPRARDGTAAFFTWWLRLRDLATQPKADPAGVFTAEVRAALQREAPAFGTSVILDGDGRYETLMTAPYTFMNETIAAHYGVTGVSGSELRQVSFGTPDRVGLLGEAGVLARFAADAVVSWPPRRFWLVKQTLLCTIGLDSSVPINTSGFVIAASPALRAQIETITAPAMCRPCHAAVNPLGDAFIQFDSLGQRATGSFAGPYDDASGTLPAGAGGYFTADFSFTGQPDFMRQIAARPEARDCFAWIALNFAVNRPSSPEVNTLSIGLRSSLDTLAPPFEASGDIRALLVAIVETPGFLQATAPVSAVVSP